MVKVAGKLLLLFCLAGIANAASLHVRVDRTTLAVNEPLLLNLTLLNSDTRLRARGLNPNVDLSILTGDFELGIPRTSHRYNIERNRGRSTSELTVQLFPRHRGTLTIPAFSIDGLRTQAISLKVLPAAANKSAPVFIRSGVTAATVWQGQQTIAFLDLYHRVALQSAELGGRLDTTPRQLRLNPLPQRKYHTTIDGFDYQVVRRAWQLTPLSEEPVTLLFPDIWVITQSGRKIRLPFSQSTVTVKALPANIPPGTLIGKPQLTQRLESGAQQLNTPISWQISLTAAVNLNSLPEDLPLLTNQHALKVYLDHAQRQLVADSDPDQPLSSATYQGYLIPLLSGTITTPTIQLPYFDPQEARLRTATLKGIALQIANAPKISGTATIPATATITTTGKQAATFQQQNPTGWQLATLLLSLLWLGTLSLWGWRHRQQDANGGKSSGTPRTFTTHGAPPLTARLHEALQARSLEQGLRQWEQAHGPDPRLRQLIHDLQGFYYGRKRNDEQALHTRVSAALARIGTAGVRRQAAPAPWQPESFYSGSGNET